MQGAVLFVIIIIVIDWSSVLGGVVPHAVSDTIGP